MKDLVTVIIPVYNLEEYLPQSLPTVLNQTYRDLEILLVNDGSRDETLRICEKFAACDSRVHLIHQENAGVSAARNTGLDAARGELIAFADGDDLIAPDYIERLAAAAEGHVLSMCMHERVTDYSYRFPESNDPFLIFPAEECAKRELSGNFPVCVWGGIFHRHRIGDLRFPTGIRNNEDKCFLYEYLLRNEDGAVAFTNQKMYGYYVRAGSATRSAWNGSRDTILMADRMHELTLKKHLEWIDQSTANRIGVRLGTLKAIITSGGGTPDAKKAFQEIKSEVLSMPLPSCAGRTTKIEYRALGCGDWAYRALVKVYYGVMSDTTRMKRNERATSQAITEDYGPTLEK